MTVQNHRIAALIQSREDLARAIDRFQKLSHTAKETLGVIRRENRDLHKRLDDLTTLLDQERSISSQNELISHSASNEVSHLKAEIAALKAKRDEQDAFMLGQLEAITESKQNLEAATALVAEKESTLALLRKELEAARHEVAVLESRLATVSEDRDKIKSLYVEQEREDAQWALKLSEKEADRARGAIEKILEQVSKLGHSGNGQAASE